MFKYLKNVFAARRRLRAARLLTNTYEAWIALETR